jgi:hypothetical protein
MEEVKPASKSLFVSLVWGVVAGALCALSSICIDWYATRHIESPYRIVARFVTLIVLGICWEVFQWDRRGVLPRRKPTRTRNIARLVFFISLMLWMAYTLWKMTRH